MYLQKEKQRYTEMRDTVSLEMEEVKKCSQSIEEVGTGNVEDRPCLAIICCIFIYVCL